MKTEAILNWLDSLPEEYKVDISAVLMPMLSDNSDMALEPHEHIEEMRSWLNSDGEFEYRTVGKALGFIHCFEYFFGSRFHPEGWDNPRRIFEKVLEEHDNEGMRSTARKSLEDMPRKQEDWSQIGRSWEKAKENIDLRVSIKPIDPETRTIAVKNTK